jgi:hypothetical protein
MSAIVELVEDTVGNLVDLVEDTAGNVVDLVEDTVGNVVEVIGDAVDWVMDDIINPIVEGIGDTIQYVLDNPIEAIAKIAAVASGQLWAIALVDAAIVLDNGGDFNDALKAAAISYAGASIGATTGQYASAAVVKAGGTAIMASIVSAGAKSATTALVYGQDPLKAFATGGMQAAMGATLGWIDDKMEGSFEKLQDGAKDTIFAGLAAELEGGNLSETQMGSIIAKYTGVGDYMDKFLTDNIGLSAAQAAVVTSAVMSSVSTALAGNPELSGEAFFAEFSKAGAEDLKRLIDKPVNKAIDKISGAYTDAEAKANLLNDATNNAATAAEKYNGVQATLATRIAEQDRLRGVYDVELANYNKNQSAATADSVNAASKAYNDYATKLETDYNETLKPQLDAHQADFNKWNTQIPDLEKSYTDSMAWVVTKAEDLDTELKPVMSAADKAVALTLSPTFDEAAYRKMNGLSATDDVYSHYLGQGQNLPTSKTAIDAVLEEARFAAAEQSLAAKGIDLWSLDTAQQQAVLAYANKNLTSISAITGTDFSTFADKLIDVAKNTSTTAVTDYKKASNVRPADIANGGAQLTSVDGELQWMLASEIASAFGGQVVGTKLAPAGSNPNVLRIEITQGNLQTNTVYTVPDFNPGKSLSSMVTDARENNSFSSSLANTVMGLGEEAGRLFDTYVGEPIYDGVTKLYDYYVKDSTAEAALQNTASIVTGATGELLQAVSGLAVLAGINPADTLIGKAARSLLDVSGDLQTEDYAAGVKAINDQIGAAKGWRDTASAIYGAFADHPIQFLGEYVVKELIQEIPILLISGGTGNIAKKALLEAGEVFAKKAATRAAVSTGIALDMTEAFGGTAAGAFDEAYATATKTGMSEQDATDYALDVAQKAGAMATVMVLGTAGIGGQALSKSIFGDKVSDSTVEAVDTFFKRVKEGGKVTIKEGITEGIEEALPQLYIATNLAQIDPTYDVAGSVTASAILGKIAGAGTAGGIYTGHAVTDALMSVNSEVNSTISSATSATDLQQKLGALGVSDQLVVNNLLASKYGAEYTSSAEADAVFAKSNPSYTPTQEELDSFVGANKDADIQKLVDSHIDTRFIDIEEVKKAAAEEGITLTDEQAAAYVGQKDEFTEVNKIKAEYDPQATINEEARQFFNDLGFTPTNEQVSQFVGATSEEEQKAAIAEFVDPRYTDSDEAKALLTELGYNPTDEEVTKFVGQVEETQSKTAVGEYVDPRQVTEEEARQYFTDLGYTPTDEQVAQFVAQVEETTQQDVISKYVDPRQVTRDELQAIANEEGLTLTDALAAAYVGQGEAENFATETLDTARKEYDPLATTQSEAEAFFASTGYTATPAEIAAFVASKAEDVQTSAIGAYVDPRQITADEAKEFLSSIGYNPTEEEIAQFTGQLNDDTYQVTQKTAIDEYVDPRYVDAGEVRAAYEELGLVDVAQEDVDRFVGQYMEEDQLGAIREYIPTATFNVIKSLMGSPSIADNPDTDADESKDATGIYKLIEDSENAGATRDEALQAGIDALGDKLGLTRDELLAEIGLTKEELTAKIDTVSEDVAGLTEDVAGLDTKIGDVETSLLDRIATYESAGISRDEALSLALDDLSADLGTTRTDLLTEIGKSEADLLTALGETETKLTDKITGLEETLGTDIQTVADLIGKPAREVTQADIDFVIDLIAQENVSAELIAQYDVTGDGIVDINDQTMLETALQGGDVTLAATSMFDPATGLYLQQEQDTQALLDEQARIAEELRIQQELDTQTVLDQNTELNTQLNTQINTQSEALAKQAQDTEFRRMRDAGMFAGANRSATTPDPMNIDYLYNFESIFANPEQAGLFNSPYGAQRARPANQPTGPMPRASGFARGGQVEDENDMLLRILGDM